VLTGQRARARAVARVLSGGCARCFSQGRWGSHVSAHVRPGTSSPRDRALQPLQDRLGDLLLSCDDIPNLTVRALDRRGGVLSNSDECCKLTD